MTPADGWDRDERETLASLDGELETVRARHAHDPGLNLLRAADADALPPELQSRVSEHLTGSEWSRALVAGAHDVEHVLDPADVERLLGRLKKSAEPRRATSRWRLLFVPLAATAAIAAVVGMAWLAWRGAHQAAPSSPASASVPHATLVRTEPARFELPLQKPDVRLSVAALTWRGSTTGAVLVDELAPALDAFRRSDYGRAEQILRAVEPRYPTAFDPPYYRGLSLLFLNDAAGAIGELKTATRLADSTFAADAAWYLAVSEQRAGRTADARTTIERLCRTSNARARDACDAIGRMDGAR